MPDSVPLNERVVGRAWVVPAIGEQDAPIPEVATRGCIRASLGRILKPRFLVVEDIVADDIVPTPDVHQVVTAIREHIVLKGVVR
jgi:hypothetical protein